MSREKMDKRLLEVEEKYRFLLDEAPVSIWFTVYEEPIDITLPEMEIARLINETGVIVEANGTVAKECGFDEVSQLIGRHWSEFVSFEENEEFYLKFVRSNYNIRGNRSVETDREGNISYNEISLLGNIVDGKLVSSFGVGGDITRRVQAEEELKKSNEMYQTLMKNSLDGIWFSVYEKPIDITLPEAEVVRLMGEREIIAEANDVVARMHGFDSGSQLTGKRWAELDSDEYSLQAATEMVRNHYKIGSYVYTTEDSEGNIRYLEESDIGNIVDDKLVSSFGVVRDITERKKMEEKLKGNEKKYRLLFETAPDGIELLDSQGNIVDCNKAEEMLIGFSREEIIGKHTAAFFSEDSKDIFRKTYPLVKKNGYGQGEIKIISKGDRVINVWRTASAIYDENKEFVGALTYNRDITERKKTEEKLRESVERYRFLMNNSPDGIWFSVFEEPIDITLPEAEVVRLIGEREVIVEANDVLAKMEGFDSGSQLTGKRWAELDSDEYSLQAATEMARNHYKVDRRVYTEKDSEGNIAYFEESEVANIVDGKLVSSFGISRDITERKRMEKEKKELEQKAQLASRLATVGEMASGIAHEINNPLTGVIGFSQLLAQREDMPEDIKEQLGIIAEGSQRVASIVSRLLAFARQ
ncbi:MAG: PAS domain S-box protein, partial [Dehalococcoidia bacterium]|nr:PAS domain S-box protein [Dehalococcoidia bacterium]